ncbi:MAG TPA: type VI secretion system accessory protein TagJ [Bryobacteraceae bacterium]|jgi:type VI secretion system protein ImpE
MNAAELYREGRLNAAIQALSAELRDNPADQKRRTFLFELLCFAGEYERAEKHLDVLAGAGIDAATGTLMYKAALAGERTRNELFAKKDYPSTPAEPVKGTLNGNPFEELEDADPRIGPRLEIYSAGDYMWLPLAHIAAIELQPPKRLRDLLWAPAHVRTGPKFRSLELGEVLVPALSPFTFRHADDAVRLGRATVWEEEAGDAVPYGQKMLLVDGEEFPLLELRSLEIAGVDEASQTHASAQ